MKTLTFQKRWTWGKPEDRSMEEKLKNTETMNGKTGKVKSSKVKSSLESITNFI